MSKKPKAMQVEVEVSPEDSGEDVQASFINALKELGLNIEQDWNGDYNSPTKFIISMPKKEKNS